MTEGQKVQKWADAAMFEGELHNYEPTRGVMPKVYLVNMTSDPLGSIAAQAEMYKGRVIRHLDDLSDDDRRRCWEDIQKTHLQGPLECVDFQFMVEGVDRAFTHQMVRERLASYAQESQRFCVIDDLEHAITLPPTLFDTVETDGEVDALFPSMDRGQRWRTRYDAAIKTIREQYQALVADGMPQEDARALLPHATATRLSYKTNLRSLSHHAGNRLCTQAQFHWRYVFNQIADAIGNYPMTHPIHPGTEWQYLTIAKSNLFRPVCYKLGHCPFNASFDRPCTIRERVQAGMFEQIDYREWAFDPTAARVAQ